MKPATSFFETLRPAEIVLAVADLNALRRFYESELGLHAIEEAPGLVRLSWTGVPPAVLTLRHAPGAQPRPRDAAGLFHVAYLFPDRPSLGRMVQRLVERGLRFGGGDHLVSEAVYLADPEGNGIELYADRPAEAWPVDASGGVAMDTLEVDFAGLAEAARRAPEPAEPPAVRIGHIHLSAARLEAHETLFSGLLGIPVRQRSYPGALFFGRDGYHHHLASNVWRSRRAAPPGSLGLERATLEMTVDGGVEALLARLRKAGIDARSCDGGALELKTPDGIALRIAPLADAQGA